VPACSSPLARTAAVTLRDVLAFPRFPFTPSSVFSLWELESVAETRPTRLEWGSGRSRIILLGESVLSSASLFPHKTFMPGSFPHMGQSQAHTNPCSKRQHAPDRWHTRWPSDRSALSAGRDRLYISARLCSIRQAVRPVHKAALILQSAPQTRSSSQNRSHGVLREHALLVCAHFSRLKRLLLYVVYTVEWRACLTHGHPSVLFGGVQISFAFPTHIIFRVLPGSALEVNLQQFAVQ